MKKSLEGFLMNTGAAVLLISMPFASAYADTFEVLHVFDGFSPDDDSQLVFDGTRLYGVAPSDSTSNPAEGVIFAINPDGTGYTILHEFTGTDGSRTDGRLTLDGARLYGVAEDGGSHGDGTIFAIDTDGTDFSVLHNLNQGIDEGDQPVGALIVDGSTIYGTTSVGGVYNSGVAFKVGTDGTGYTVLHNFNSAVDGDFLLSGLSQDGTTLFGMTNQDPITPTGGGTIYSLQTDGTAFTILHTFQGGTANGEGPRSGSLLLDGSTLYGMTDNGGTNDDGVIFSIGTDGTGFSILHEFDQSTDGKDAEGSLILVGSTLYGMTEDGGATDDGIIFSIGTDDTDFSILHEFDRQTDGGEPEGSLLYVNGVFYGMTNAFGSNSTSNGTIFSFAPATPTTMLSDLVVVVMNLNTQAGIANSLEAKLDSALAALDDMNANNDVSAINSVYAFINAVEAQRGNKISNEDADALILAAQAIISALEAQ